MRTKRWMATCVVALLSVAAVLAKDIRVVIFKVSQMHCENCEKKVAFDPETKEYIQLQAVKPVGDDVYVVQKFDNELVFMGEIWSGCKHKDEVLDWMRSNYEVDSCLTAEVYRNPLGDCTNDGISSYQRELYVLAAQKGPFEPEDIRQCVYIERREIMLSLIHI